MLSDDIVMRAIKYLFSHPMPNVAVTMVLLSAASYNVRAAAKQLLDNVPREREGIDDELVVVPVETAVEIFLLMPEGSISVRDKWGQHPLHWAVSVRHDNVGADGADGAKGSGGGGGDGGGDAAVARRAREEVRQRSTGATVKALLKIDPGGARIADSHGRLPLHWACESAVPSEVAIELLVEAFPEGVMAQDQAGLLPLHYISANLAAEAAMVAVVLEAAPETAGVPALHGMLALHFACRAENSLEEWADAVDLLLEYHPEGAELADERFGMLPLHWACHTHVPNEAVVLALLATYPGAAGRADVRWGNLPLHWLCSSRAPMLTLVDALLEAYPDGAKEVDTRAGRLPLHFACENPHAAPEVVRVLLEAHPDSVREADELVGRLPLHWICRNKTAPPALALEIVHMYKQGVSVLDETGMLPLHIACDAKRANDRVVKALVDEYPDGVYKRDKQVRASALITVCHSRGDHGLALRCCAALARPLTHGTRTFSPTPHPHPLPLPAHCSQTGSTPIEFACRASFFSSQVARLLLEAEPDDGQMALDACQRAGNTHAYHTIKVKHCAGRRSPCRQLALCPPLTAAPPARTRSPLVVPFVCLCVCFCFVQGHLRSIAIMQSKQEQQEQEEVLQDEDEDEG